MAEFSVRDVEYRSGRLAAMTAFHVVRRLTPVVASLRDLIPAIKAAAADGGRLDPEKIDLAPLLPAMADAVSKMTDADSEYVVNACMTVVDRRQGTGWTKVWSPQAKRSMFEDIDMMAMLEIVGRVLLDNLSSFSASLGPGSSAEAQASASIQ